MSWLARVSPRSQEVRSRLGRPARPAGSSSVPARSSAPQVGQKVRPRRPGPRIAESPGVRPARTWPTAATGVVGGGVVGAQQALGQPVHGEPVVVEFDQPVAAQRAQARAGRPAALATVPANGSGNTPRSAAGNQAVGIGSGARNAHNPNSCAAAGSVPASCATATRSDLANDRG